MTLKQIESWLICNGYILPRRASDGSRLIWRYKATRRFDFSMNGVLWSVGQSHTYGYFKYLWVAKLWRWWHKIPHTTLGPKFFFLEKGESFKTVYPYVGKINYDVFGDNK